MDSQAFILGYRLIQSGKTNAQEEEPKQDTTLTPNGRLNETKDNRELKNGHANSISDEQHKDIKYQTVQKPQIVADIKIELSKKNPLLQKDTIQPKQELISSNLVKRNPNDLIKQKPSSPFNLLSKGFEPAISIAKDTLDSSVINFAAFKQQDNFFAKQHQVFYDKRQGRYLTAQEITDLNAEKERRRTEWNDRMAAEHAAKLAAAKAALQTEEIKPKSEPTAENNNADVSPQKEKKETHNDISDNEELKEKKEKKDKKNGRSEEEKEAKRAKRAKKAKKAAKREKKR